MKNKLIWLEAFLVITPFVLLAGLWNKLHNRFPMHWNLNGQIDGWSSNRWEILILPLITLGVVALCHVVPRLDPKLRNSLDEKDRMQTALRIICVSLAGLF